MIPIAKPLIGEREKELVMEVLNSGVIAQGPKVREFEEKFAKYVSVGHAVAASSGTTALHIALLASGIGRGNEVITTPFSFVATGNSILYCNAKPVFADIEDQTFNIDPESIKEKITDKTKAIMPVHLYGHPADMKAIMEIAQDHDLAVIEDACQAHGARINDISAGGFSTAAFSFYPTKNMTTSEGGIVTTDDAKTADMLRMLREHGSKERYHHEILGYNYRMTDICAAIGIGQLERLEEFNSARIKNAEYLTWKLNGINGIITPRVLRGARHVFHQYTIRITEEFPACRDDLATTLKEKGVGTGIYYPIPIHKQALYRNLGYDDRLPVAEEMAKQVLSLPVNPTVSAENLDYIAETILEVSRKSNTAP